ncbi:retrovirus-related Pol polyprotein [Pseudoscourfieldia marina]
MTHLKREKSRNKHYGRHTKRFGQKEIRRAQKRLPSVQGGCGALEEVGFYNIERDIKLENLEEIDEETWVRTTPFPTDVISIQLKATLSGANDAYENEKKNGILLLHRLWKLHGAPNLANTISADGTTEHRNHYAPRSRSEPAVAGAYFDRVFPRHTGQHEDRLAHADGEYRQIPRILDSMKIPGMVIPTYLELKRRSEPLCDRSRRARAKMKGGKRKARGGKSHTKAEDLASCRFGNLPSRRGAKTLTKNATALATNEGLPQLKRPQLCNNVGKSRSNIPPDRPNPRPGGGRGRGGRGAAGGRGRGYGRGYTRGSRSRSIRSKDYERESTSSGDNLHNHLTKSSSLVRLAANGGTSRSADSSSTTTEETRTPSRSSTTSSRRVPTTPSRASTPHRFRTAAPVEGGGGDGLDEVDKFIHDALNQAPPIEGGASPIEGGGEPDLGALGIHGHANDGQRPGVQAHHADNGDHTYEAYNHCEAVFDANKTLSITLVIPDWSPSPLTAEYLFNIPQEKRYTVTQMASHAARRDGMSRFTDSADPHMTDLLLPSSRNTRLEDIESKMCSSGKRAISSIQEIHTANKGTTFVYLIGLLEYHPVYEIAVSNGEFDDAKKNEFDVKGTRTYDGTDADTNPILTSENRKNIFVPTNSRELMAMKPGPLKSLYLEAMGTEISNMERNGVYRWVYLPAGQHTIRGRVIFEIKFDPITGLLLKAKARLVAQGFTQIFGVDFFETYASTPKVSTPKASTAPRFLRRSLQGSQV